MSTFNTRARCSGRWVAAVGVCLGLNVLVVIIAPVSVYGAAAVASLLSLLWTLEGPQAADVVPTVFYAAAFLVVVQLIAGLTALTAPRRRALVAVIAMLVQLGGWTVLLVQA